MIKKILLFTFTSFLSFNAFSYMQVNFGVGSVNYYKGSNQGDTGTVYLDFSGYTENNLMYSATYLYEGWEQYYFGSYYQVDSGYLGGSIGYGFSDISTGSWFIEGKYESISASVDNVNVDALIDTARITGAVGYTRQAEEGTNFTVKFVSILDDCESYEVCEALFSKVDFPIPNSNWNFGLRLDVGDGITHLGIGPLVKF